MEIIPKRFGTMMKKETAQKISNFFLKQLLHIDFTSKYMMSMYHRKVMQNTWVSKLMKKQYTIKYSCIINLSNLCEVLATNSGDMPMKSTYK